MPAATIGALFAGLISGLAITAIYGLGSELGPLLFLAQFLNFVALVPTMTVGLSHGPVGLGIGVAAAAAVGLLTGVRVPVLYLLLFGLPQIWLVHLALLRRPGPSGMDWYPAGRLLAWLVLISCCFLAALWLVAAGRPGGLTGMLEHDIVEFLRRLTEMDVIRMSADGMAELARRYARMIPVAVAYIWVIVMAVNGAVAQAIAVRQGRNLRPTPDFAELELPDSLVYAFGLLLVGGLILPGRAGELTYMLAYLVSAGFFVAGLAVVHAAIKRFGWSRSLIVVFYLFVAIMTWLAIAVMLLGLADKVFGLRRRFMAASRGEEED